MAALLAVPIIVIEARRALRGVKGGVKPGQWGGLFGALRNRVPGIGSAAGLTYGTALWLIGDELMMPVLKLSPPSTDFPWQNHARAFTNHAAYGTTVRITLEALSQLDHYITI
ncbi:MAG: hypothetical protein ACYCSN_00525 [Acidobacteriaceae bacterium]